MHSAWQATERLSGGQQVRSVQGQPARELTAAFSSREEQGTGGILVPSPPRHLVPDTQGQDTQGREEDTNRALRAAHPSGNKAEDGGKHPGASQTLLVALLGCTSPPVAHTSQPSHPH